MSAENKVIIPLPRQSKEIPKVTPNGLSRELTNRLNLHILNGEKVNTANGKKLDKANGKLHQSSEKFAPPQESSDIVKDATMSVSDLFKEDRGEMFGKIFGANVDGKKISFPESNVSFQLAPSEKGSAIAEFQNGDKMELRSLSGWAVRDAENGDGPAVDFISPQRKNGTFEMFKIREGNVTHKVITMPSTPGEYFATNVSKELPRNEKKREDHPFKTYRGAVPRDLPFSSLTPEQQKSATKMQEVGEEKEKKALEAIEAFRHKEGPLSEKDIKDFEKQTIESLEEVVAFKKK